MDRRAALVHAEGRRWCSCSCQRSQKQPSAKAHCPQIERPDGLKSGCLVTSGLVAWVSSAYEICRKRLASHVKLMREERSDVFIVYFFAGLA